MSLGVCTRVFAIYYMATSAINGDYVVLEHCRGRTEKARLRRRGVQSVKDDRCGNRRRALRGATCSRVDYWQLGEFSQPPIQRRLGMDGRR